MNLPSTWSVQDVDDFYTFLRAPPEYALCERDYAGRYAELGDGGYTPFRCVPSASSRSDIQRCVHALFRAWREVGYVQSNPMGFHGAGTERKRYVPFSMRRNIPRRSSAASRNTWNSGRSIGVLEGKGVHGKSQQGHH